MRSSEMQDVKTRTTSLPQDSANAGAPGVQKRILFVDDEPNVLHGLRRMLHPLRRAWDMAFTGSGDDALAILAGAPFDVVVSDMRMPGMDGVQLLTQVKKQYPHIVRIVLSGHADHETSMKSVALAHQYLAKPCDAATLQATVARASALCELLRDTALQRLVAGITTLPSLPTLYLEVMEAVQAEASLEHVGTIIARDMSMTAKILQLVNSAFFGVRRHIASPVQAVSLLGLDTIKALILSVQIFAHCDQALLRALALDTLWHHSLATATCAKHIARVEGCERTLIDEAFMAGLLHDVGKLVLAANLPDQYRDVLVMVQTQAVTEWEAELATLGTTHAEVGAYLVGLWGLPDALVEALAFHHRPSACPNHAFSPLTAVHVANAVVHADGATETAEDTVPVDDAYLEACGLRARLAVWRAHAEAVRRETQQACKEPHDTTKGRDHAPHGITGGR